MKKLLLIAAVIAAGASLQAQSVIFANTAAYIGTTEPVKDADGTLAGAGFMAELYLVGTGGSLTAVGDPIAFKTGGKAGQFVDTNPRATSLAAGANGTFQVAAWKTTSDTGVTGLTWDQVQTAPGGHWGLSAPVTLAVGNDANPTVPPPGLTGLLGFTLTVNPVGPIPEPSTLALGALGLGALLLRRRS